MKRLSEDKVLRVCVRACTHVCVCMCVCVCVCVCCMCVCVPLLCMCALCNFCILLVSVIHVSVRVMCLLVSGSRCMSNVSVLYSTSITLAN